MSKKKYQVVHPRTYLAVDGKLQHVPKGTELELNKKQADGLGARVAPVGQAEAIDLSDAGTGGGEGDKAERLAQLKARAAELNIEGANRFGEARLIEEIQKAEAAIAEANNAVNG